MLKLLLVGLLLLGSCRPRRDLSQYVQDDPKSSQVSSFRVSDPKYASQILDGFFQIEEGGWRWVSNKFKVELRPPFASQKLGARLQLKVNLPEVVFSRTGPITLSAKLNQTMLPPQTFQSTGDVLYSVDVPPAAMAADQIVVEFSTDKFLPPNTFPNDGRQLALIVTAISLDTKK